MDELDQDIADIKHTVDTLVDVAVMLDKGLDLVAQEPIAGRRRRLAKTIQTDARARVEECLP